MWGRVWAGVTCNLERRLLFECFDRVRMIPTWSPSLPEMVPCKDDGDGDDEDAEEEAEHDGGVAEEQAAVVGVDDQLGCDRS